MYRALCKYNLLILCQDMSRHLPYCDDLSFINLTESFDFQSFQYIYVIKKKIFLSVRLNTKFIGFILQAKTI